MHHSLCDIALDIAQNAIDAGAATIVLRFAEGPGRLDLEIEDDGGGMDGDQLKRALDPFAGHGEKHPGRKVGLGIPLLLQTLEMTGGSHELSTEKGKGTRWRISFDLSHLDCPPVGDRVGLFRQLLCWGGDRELVVERSLSGPGGTRSWRIARSGLLGALGSLDDAEAIALAGAFIESQEGDVGDGEDDA